MVNLQRVKLDFDGGDGDGDGDDIDDYFKERK